MRDEYVTKKWLNEHWTWSDERHVLMDSWWDDGRGVAGKGTEAEAPEAEILRPTAVVGTAGVRNEKWKGRNENENR